MYPVLNGVSDVIFDQQFLSALRDRNTAAEDFLIAHFALLFDLFADGGSGPS